MKNNTPAIRSSLVKALRLHRKELNRPSLRQPGEQIGDFVPCHETLHSTAHDPRSPCDGRLNESMLKCS